MTTEHGGDDDLREAFAALRGVDAAAAPSYDDVIARAQAAAQGTPAPLLPSALAAAAVLAALVLGIAVRWTPQPSPPPPALGAWRAPTDFLLRTPGSEILGSVPRFGLHASLLAPDGAARPESKRGMP